MVHVRDVYGGFEGHGAPVLMVAAAQDPEELKKFLEFHGLPYAVLSDAARKTQEDYGIGRDIGPPRGVVPNPTVIVLDPRGVIRYLHIGESSDDFPDSRDVWAAVDAL